MATAPSISTAIWISESSLQASPSNLQMTCGIVNNKFVKVCTSDVLAAQEGLKRASIAWRRGSSEDVGGQNHSVPTEIPDVRPNRGCTALASRYHSLGMSNATLLSPAPSRTFLGLAWPERLAPAERRSLVAGGGWWGPPPPGAGGFSSLVAPPAGGPPAVERPPPPPPPPPPP